ncbi:hypothetical protein RND81_09G009800 [Saponaria officinalis]|uniref:Pentatricopeptide repeat-containing protein n=1 Tax=Saponaria officinalis TaxID=3572 RepID=A0AAW1IHE0_SAPOF
MEKLKKISQFRLSSLLRQQNDPIIAFNLFLNPNFCPNSNPKPFNHSLLSYDLIITKLGRAKMFHELELILSKLKLETRFNPTEIMFCNVITYYCRARLPDKALQVFDEMPTFRCRRTVKSLNTLLNGLLICREFEIMERIFVGFESFDCPDVCTYNVMINACRMQGDLVSAWKVFDEMRKRRIQPNVVTFSTLIVVLCESSKLKEAFKLMIDMSRVYKVDPNVYVYASLIKGLCEVKELNQAFRVKDEMLKRKIEVDSAVYTTLISGLFKVGRKDEVEGVLEEMKSVGCKPDTVTYNAIITGYCAEDRFDLGLRVLNEMESKGCKPDVISFNVIIRAYVNAGLLREAMDLFEDMPRRGCKPDVLSYRILVQGLIDGMVLKDAILFLDEMIFKGFAPYPTAINAFMKRLREDKNFELLFEVLSTLAKGNYIDIDCWKLVIDVVFKKSEFLNFCDVFDALITSEDTQLL